MTHFFHFSLVALLKVFIYKIPQQFQYLVQIVHQGNPYMVTNAGEVLPWKALPWKIIDQIVKTLEVKMDLRVGYYNLSEFM